MIGSTQITLDCDLFEKQQEVWRSKKAITVLLAGKGFGKTSLGALMTVRIALQNGWVPQYGRKNPTFLVEAPSRDNLINVQFPEILKWMPSQFIRSYKQNPPEVTLSNGCVIRGVPFRGSGGEGTNPVGAWIDEAHFCEEPRFVDLFQRFQRDSIPHQLGRETKFFITGVPYWGTPLEKYCKRSTDVIDVFHGSMLDNPHLTEVQRRTILETVPAHDKKAQVYGDWAAPMNVIFPEFNFEEHVKPTPYDPRHPVLCGVDCGTNFTGVLFAQKIGSMLRVFAEHEGEKDEARTWNVAQKMKSMPGNSSISTFCFDPTTKPEQKEPILQAFPNRSIKQLSNQDRKAREQYGIACIRKALKDSSGNVSLQIDPSCKKLVHILARYEYILNSNKPKWMEKDHDHLCDALRYITAFALPLKHEPPAKLVQKSVKPTFARKPPSSRTN